MIQDLITAMLLLLGTLDTVNAEKSKLVYSCIRTLSTLTSEGKLKSRKILSGGRLHSTDERRVFPTPSHGVKVQGIDVVSSVHRVIEATVNPVGGPAYASGGWQCNASAVLKVCSLVARPPKPTKTWWEGFKDLR